MLTLLQLHELQQLGELAKALKVAEGQYNRVTSDLDSLNVPPQEETPSLQRALSIAGHCTAAMRADIEITRSEINRRLKALAAEI